MWWITSNSVKRIKMAYAKTHLLKWRSLLFGAALAMVIPNAHALPADENYDDDSGVTFNNTNSFTSDGVTYTIAGSATYSSILANNSIFSPLGNDAGDYFLLFDSDGEFNITSITIAASDNSYFRLSGLSFDGLADANITITPYDGAAPGTAINYASNGNFVTHENINLSGNTSFQYITSVRISGGNIALALDDLNFEAAVLPAPVITSATYNTSTGALAVTGTNFTATDGATNDVVANKFTLTAEGGSTYALTDTASVEISNATSFTLTLSATDRAAANLLLNKNGTSSTGGTTYNLAGMAGFIADSAAAADLNGNGITVSNTATPTVTSATYNANTGVLVVTGADLKSRSGATNDIVANKFTLIGEGGSTWTLTDTANVDVTSGTSFTMILSATDRAGANLIMNNNGALSTDISTYNLDAAEDWNAGADAAVSIADTTGNGITVSNVAVPTITSATYNASTGTLAVTSTGLLKSNGAINDIVANKFTLTGQGGSTHTLTDTANTEITSGTSFMLTLSVTDRDAVNLLLNKNGTSSIGGTTYNLAAAEDWAAGADAAVIVADLTGNGITASNAVSAPSAPTIGTATAGDGQVSVTFTAPGSNGGSAITTYTATASPGGAFSTCAGPTACTATVTGLTNGTAYTFTVTATNAVGTSNASGSSNSVIPKANQTITFGNPGAQNFGTTPILSATTTSSLTPTFSSSTTGVCTITSGGALTFVTAGSCTVDADQAGNTAWNAATTVTQTFTVNAVVPSAPTIGTATAGDTQATVTFTAPSSIGGAAIIASGYTVTANPGGATATGSGSPMTVTGLVNGVTYTFSVTATNSVGTGDVSAASNSVTPSAPQSITFGNPGTQNFGTTPTLTATSDAGGGYPVSFTSSATDVCTITAGGALTFVTVGSCTVNADQAGDSSFLAAPQVSQTFTVAAVAPGVPTAATATAGDTQASVAFTAPAFIGGAAITSYTVTTTPADVAPVNGATSPIVIAGLTNGVPYTFTVTATNVMGTGAPSAASNSVTPNGTPVISGTPTASLDQDVAYSFIPTVSDTAGDVLTFSITNKPTWASFDTATGALTGTPTNADVGTTTGIVISVSDGTLSASLPAFNVEVLETIDPMQPVVTAPADMAINATALYTPVSLRQLLGLNTSATQEQVDQILAGLASDGVSGNTCCITNPEGLNVNNMLLLPPGRHQVTWKATNAADISVVATQTIDIRPLVSLSKSQIAIRGSAVEFRVLLNGKAPEYPVAIPYVIDVSTTAGSTEHNLVNGVANFTEAGQLQVVVPVQITDLTGLTDSELVVRLDGDINAGVSNRHVIRIREGNVAPAVTLQLSQGGVSTTQVTPTGGAVTVAAMVTDLNRADTHSYNWSASDKALGDSDGNPVNATLVFDPANLTGRHQVQLTVTDSGGASANMQLYFRMVQNLPVLSATVDTDGDGIDDLTEGYGDSSGNGIPDYLDNMPSSNVLPQVGATTTSYLIECDPGVRCGLGQFALGSNSGGVQILNEELGTMADLIVDDTYEPVGGIFDFVIRDLPTPGQSVRIVIPQQAPIPANAAYRKYQNGGWVSFVENANNTIFSAPSNPGYCPPPGNPEWTSGLTAGHLCVQLTLEDGGPNDDDGLVNSAVADPGAVSVALPVEPPPPPPPPPPPKPPVEVKAKGGGAMEVFWLLLLGVLMVFKQVKPRWITAATLITSVGSVQASIGDDVYIRADVSTVTSSENEEKFSSVLSAAGHNFVISRYDENRSGYHLAVGYEWSNFVVTELGYLDLGDVRVNLTLPGTTNIDAFAQDFAAQYPMSAEGVTLVQGLILNPASTFKVSAEIGVFIWRSKTAIDRQVFSVADNKGEDPLVGLKFELPLGEQLGLGLGMRRIYFDTQETDLFSLTGSYHF